MAFDITTAVPYKEQSDSKFDITTAVPYEEPTVPISTTSIPSFSTAVSTEDIGAETLMGTIGVSQSDVDKPKKEEIPYEDLWKKPQNLKAIREYAVARYGKYGEQEKGETDEQYVARFVSAMRYLNTNELNYFSEQDWLNSAKREDIIKAGKAYDLFENTASFLSAKGQNPLVALKDYAFGIGSAPSTALSLGVGKAVVGPVMSSTMKEGLKKTLLSRTGATAIGAPMAVETAANVTANLYDQRRELDVLNAKAQSARERLKEMTPEQQAEVLPKIEAVEKQVAEGLDLTEAAITGAITAPISFIFETGPLLAYASKSTKGGANFTLDDILDARRNQTKTGTKPDTLTGDPEKDNVTATTHNSYNGRDLLDAQGDPTLLAQMQIKNSIDKQSDLIAESIWKQMPEYAPKPNQKVYEAVQNVFDSFEKIPETIRLKAFEDAGTDMPNFMALLESAGLDDDAIKKFAAMYGATTKDAARILQSKSVMQRNLNKLKELDKEAYEQVNALFGKPDPTMTALQKVKAFVDKADKNMIVAMTLNMGTVMRNAFGIAVNTTYGAAEEALESALLNLGRKLAAKEGTPITGNIGKGINGAYDDATRAFVYLGENDLAKEITENALKNNPMLMSKLLVTAEETKKSDLIAPIRLLNTPAMLMDNYIRRAVFAASIETNLGRAGIDMFDVMANNKNIPVDILRKGVDDALTYTFSKTPTDKLGNAFIKGVEATRPFSTAVVPFARFLANSTAWTYRHYNPGFTTIGGAADIIAGVKKLKVGDDTGQQLILKGSEKISQQVTGAATLLAAYAYRSQNQDTPWNELGGVDIKYLFPLNIPFALSDFSYKTFNGNPEDFSIRSLIEAVTGFKTVGSQQQVAENVREAIGALSDKFVNGEISDDVAIDRLTNSLGDITGAWLSRPFVPLNQISDMVSAFDRNEALPRDYWIRKPGEEKTFTSSIVKPIQKMIPVLKQALPEYQPATRSKAPLRETGVLKQMTGLALVPPKNYIEKEIDAQKLTYRDVFRTTGDRTLDSMARKIMSDVIDNEIGNFIKSKEYIDADPTAKAVSLKKQFSDLQKFAKKEAEDQYNGMYYIKGLVPPLQERRYMALDNKIRKLVNKAYKIQTGKFIDEDVKNVERYAMALEMAKDLRKEATVIRDRSKKFAVGGIVGKNIIKQGIPSAAKKASTALDDALNLASEKDLMRDMQQTAQKTAIPPDDQSMEELVTAAEKSFIKEPTPPAKTWETVEGGGESQMSPDQYWDSGTSMTTDHYKFTTDFFKGFPEEEIIKVEKELANKYGDVGYIMQDHPEAFANELAFKIQKNMGFKNKEIPYLKDPTNPDSGWDELSDVGVKPKDFKPSPFYVEKKSLAYNEKALSGKLDIPKARIDDRNEIVDQIRDIRYEAFPTLKEMNKDGFDDIVLGKTQGEFRFKTGHEVDITDEADLNLFFRIAKKEQSLLDKYRKQYADELDVTLIHGGYSVKRSIIDNKGFARPTKKQQEFDISNLSHKELKVGATSFTRDFNLGPNTGYGGATPENYVKKTIPYPEWKFMRINLTPAEYDNADLNILAKSVSGDPKTTRTVGLPRNMFKEQEDIVIEPDKFYAESGAKFMRGIFSPKDNFNSKVFDKYGVSPAPAKLSQSEINTVDKEFAVKLLQMNKTSKDFKDISDKQLRDHYYTVKNYLKYLAEKSQRTDPSVGVGQQYHESLFDDASIIGKYDNRPLLSSSTLKDLASALADRGNNEKAYLVSRVADELKDALKYNQPTIGHAESRKGIPSVKRILDLTDKFSRGGLASKQ